MSKVRIYDLAQELKIESKKILEDARRMGVDVSVPSNTLEDNIAAKIREMYYPEKEQEENRLIREVTLRNVLSYGPYTEPIPLRGLNVLIGPNGSGKSNL